ncbi:hypothetical protein L204_105836 [Cryptococcus depauperatus]
MNPNIIFRTGAALRNGVVLLAISLHPSLQAGPAVRRYKWAAELIMGGTVAFSGSIFALVFDGDRVKEIGLGPVTPLGGLAMIAGYVALVF